MGRWEGKPGNCVGCGKRRVFFGLQVRCAKCQKEYLLAVNREKARRGKITICKHCNQPIPDGRSGGFCNDECAERFGAPTEAEIQLAAAEIRNSWDEDTTLLRSYLVGPELSTKNR